MGMQLLGKMALKARALLAAADNGGIIRIKVAVGPDRKLAITPAGRGVLSGQKKWLAIEEYDRWLGGVHLSYTNTWCWDETVK